MSAFPMPKRLHTISGEERRVGVEFEFAGIELEETCQLIIDLYGGRHDDSHRFYHHVREARWGDFGVEIDTSLLKDQAYIKFLERWGFEVSSVRRVEDVIGRIASTLVPHEVVSPPIPFSELPALEELRARLQEHEALGTKASLRYAFGLHFNPEAPALDAATLLAYLRAFMLLADLLTVDSQIDLARRVTPFINDFPQDYIRKILEPSYQPDLTTLIDDFLLDNPTRNRPLDMLPLFAQIDRERVDAVLDYQTALVKARPTFHYRLPNCLIDDPSWTLAKEWLGWVRVDDLANQPEQLKRLSTQYLQSRRRLSLGADERWAEQIRAELAP